MQGPDFFGLSTMAPGKGAENRAENRAKNRAENRAENLTCSPVVVASLRGAGDRGLVGKVGGRSYELGEGSAKIVLTLNSSY